MADMAPDEVPLSEARTVKDDPAARCLPPGIPRAFNNLLKILQTPGVMAIMYESYTQFRQIFVDDRPLPADPNPTSRVPFD